MKKFNLFDKSRLFFSNHSTAIKVAGSICGAAIIAFSASSCDSKSKSTPAIEKIMFCEENSNIKTYNDYAFNVEKTDGSTEWVAITDLLKDNYKDLVVKKEEVISTSNHGSKVITYNTYFLVYNDNGTKEYRSLGYLNQYAIDTKNEKQKVLK